MLDVYGSLVPMPGNQWYGSRKFRGIEEQARKRLRWLDAATSLSDLGAIRGNRLQVLRGDRAGQHSIRINDAHDVEIVDYQ